ncbi:MAG: crossover junction endodeoxyribonuclease RuvC [Balneolaceae bacterium]|jgi:crossover junction endodeoxyribonuclease RuvC|nr:MAG: crossover junction endodeoxyribonuclease RuvC [Balneolaceae bacterium]
MPKKILGIDPGSRTTGFAVLCEQENRYRVIECDVIRLDKMEGHTERLQFIFDEVTRLIRTHSPDECAIETPVYGVDPLAMLKLGRAQAAAILAMSNEGLAVAEYYPKAVKKAITGNGNASKQQVAFMLGKMMILDDEKMPEDATDALAVAWCHFIHSGPQTGNKPAKKMHQNNRKSDWAQFVADNPGRVKGND